MTRSAKAKAMVSLAPMPLIRFGPSEEQHAAQQARDARSKRLRALRLARDTTTGETAEPRRAKKKRAPLPQAHRRQL